jgi:hypothetical protein
VASYEKRPAASDETRSYQLTADGYQLSAIGLIVRTNSILGTLPPLDVNENRLKAVDGYRL